MIMGGDLSNSKPVPKAPELRKGSSVTKELRWRKLSANEKDRIKDYFQGEYFRGSLIIVTLLVISVIFTILLVASTVLRFEKGEHLQAVYSMGVLLLLYTLLIILSKLLVHRPRRELAAINDDTALACETVIEEKKMLRHRTLDEFIKGYRLRGRADVQLPYEEDKEGNVTDKGTYPVKAVGMSDSVYSKVRMGENVLVCFFPEDATGLPDVEYMQIFRQIEIFRI